MNDAAACETRKVSGDALTNRVRLPPMDARLRGHDVATGSAASKMAFWPTHAVATHVAAMNPRSPGSNRPIFGNTVDMSPGATPYHFAIVAAY